MSGKISKRFVISDLGLFDPKDITRVKRIHKLFYYVISEPSELRHEMWEARSGFEVGPTSDLKPRAIRSSACQEHTSLHTRLDKVEKTVEDTVEKLETELAVLLDAIEAPEWRPLLVTGSKTTVDILENLGSESSPERGN